MICDICNKKGARIRFVTRTYGKGANLFVVENVPVVHCRSCGESYLTAETMHELARIKLHRKTFAREKELPVAQFA